MGSLLAVYDPSGKLGLTDPSPGGGTVPTAYECPGRGWRLRDALERTTHGYFADEGEGENGLDRAIRLDYRCALVLVTEIGTPDPVGMARAREVLARVLRLDPSEGVIIHRSHRQYWEVHSRTGDGRLQEVSVIPWATEDRRPSLSPWVIPAPFLRDCESAPEALARLLSEHAGCEVIRG